MADCSHSLSIAYAECCRQAGVEVDPRALQVLEGKMRNSVRKLDFDGASPGAGTACLLDAIRNCLTLESLSLENVQLKTDALSELAKVLRTLPALSSLRLSNNSSLGFSAGKALLQMVKNSPNIVEVDLEGTGMTAATQHLIQQQLADNAALRTRGPLHKSSTQQPSVETQHSAHASTGGAKSQLPSLSLNSYPYGEEQQLDAARLSYSTSKAQKPQERQSGDARLPCSPTAEAMKLPDPVSDTAQYAELQCTINDFEDRLLRFMGESATKVDRKWQEWEARLETGQRQLGKLYMLHSIAQEGGVTVQQLAEEAGLELGPDMVKALESRYNPQEHPAALPQVVELAMDALGLPGAAQMSPRKVQRHVPCLDPGIATALDKIEGIVGADPVTAEQVMAGLAASNQLRNRLQQSVDELETKRSRAILAEDLSHAELLHDDSIELQGQLNRICLERITALADPGGHSSAGPTLERLVGDVLQQVTEGQAAVQEEMGRLRRDMGRLDEARERRGAEQQAATSEFQAQERHHAELLRANVQKQKEIWQHVLQGCNALARLSEQRYDVVQRYLHGKEAQEQFRGETAQWVAQADRHRDRLRDLLRVATDHADLLGNVALTVQSGRAALQSRLDGVRGQVERVLFEEQRQHHAVFRRYYLTVGELLYKKEKRLEEISKMIDQNNFQIAFAKEALDPNGQAYRAHNAELARLHEEIGAKVDWLKERADESVTDIGPTVKALQDGGLDVQSPVVELQEILVERRSKANQVRQGFFALQQAKAAEERQDIHRKAQIVRQARATGLSQLVAPLSPRSPKPPTPRLPPPPGGAATPPRISSAGNAGAHRRGAGGDGDAHAAPRPQRRGSTDSPGQSSNGTQNADLRGHAGGSSGKPYSARRIITGGGSSPHLDNNKDVGFF